MDLSQWSDDQLLSKTKKLVKVEREILTHILHHFREIERRRLYCNQSSLFSYAVTELKYSESQAQRRISAMRLLGKIPEMERSVTSGALSLTHLNMVASLPTEVSEKREILKQLENTSIRQAERIVLEKYPELKKQIRDIVLEDPQMQKKAERLKGLLAHKYPKLSNLQLFDLLMDQAIESFRPSPPKGVSRQTARMVWQRAENKCEICGSVHALQVDHVRPRAFGGGSERENLRLLCRNCNQRAAIQVLGLKKMSLFLRSN